MRNKSRKRILQELRIQNSRLNNALRQKMEDHTIIRTPKFRCVTSKKFVPFLKDMESFNLEVESAKREIANELARSIIRNEIARTTVSTKDGITTIETTLYVIDQSGIQGGFV